MPEEYFRALCPFCEYKGELKNGKIADEELTKHIKQYHPGRAGLGSTQCIFPVLKGKEAEDALKSLRSKHAN